MILTVATMAMQFAKGAPIAHADSSAGPPANAESQTPAAPDASLKRGEPSRSSSRLLPAVLIATGAIPLVAGAVISYRTPPPDAGAPQVPYLFSGPAIGVSVAGGAAVAAGLYLLFRGDRHASSPAVTPTRGGGVVSWAGAF